MDRRTLIGLNLLMAVALLVVGCQKRPTDEEIVLKMQEVEASTEDVHGVIEFSVQEEGKAESAVIEVWEKKPDKARAEVLETDSSKAAPGAVAVSDGQQVWIYDPIENEVLTGDVSAIGDEEDLANPRDLIRLVDEGVQWVQEHADAELVGEEDVAGTPTYKLRFTPKEDAELPVPVTGEATLWVDQERWVALKAHFVVEGVAEGSMVVRSFELNTGLDDALFQFEVPEGATVIAIDEKKPTNLALDEALAEAEFLLVPSYVPEGVTLIDVFKLQEGYVFYYDHSETSFTVIQGPFPMDREIPGAKTEVTVRGQTATLIADQVQGNTLLTWTESGIRIAIAGHITEQEIVKVAESLE
jgi:outer membrane lipoprotein-sorting protein